MSMLNTLSANFSVMLEDWGEEITLTHNVSTELNTDTGKYTTITTTATLQGICSKVESKEVALNPNKYKITDTKIRYKKSDTDIVLIEDDTITYNSSIYAVISIKLICGIWEAIIRRVK